MVYICQQWDNLTYIMVFPQINTLPKLYTLHVRMGKSICLLDIRNQAYFIDCNNPPLWSYYLLRLTNLDFTHQDLPHPSVSMHFSQPSRGRVNATLHQACQLVDYTPDSSTRLLHYLHIKPQISWTDQQWSSGRRHSFFRHGKGATFS